MEERSREPEALAPTIAATGVTPGGAPDSALPAGEVLGERYSIVELVGRGGQGDVYRAEDLEVAGHVVALKLLHNGARSDEERAFATRELRMLAAVSHPSIVRFNDSGWYGTRLWFVMPWLEGGTLEQRGRISRAEVRRIFESVVAGVAALHAKGMRHQDIKPSNIFLARIDGFDATMPVLLDLGVAARDGDAVVAGSPDYFAPEMAAGWPAGATMGPEADVYALALTMRNALDPETAPSLDCFSKTELARRATEPVAPPKGRELRYLAPVFERWLAIDPARRPKAAAMLRELAILTAPEDRRRERARTLRRIAPYAAILVVALAIAGWWVNAQMVAGAKAARIAAREQREAELAANAARVDAHEARSSERVALARAEWSAGEADRRGTEAQAALARVRAARVALGRAEGDRARLAEVLEELQSAIDGAENARRVEQRARAAERTESEAVLRVARDLFASERRDLIDARDRALALAAETEARVRQAQARADEAEARLAAAEARASTAEARVSTAEARATEGEGSASGALARVREAEARASEAEWRVAELEATVRGLREGSPPPREPPPPPPSEPPPEAP